MNTCRLHEAHSLVVAAFFIFAILIASGLFFFTGFLDVVEVIVCFSIFPLSLHPLLLIDLELSTSAGSHSLS